MVDNEEESENATNDQPTDQTDSSGGGKTNYLYEGLDAPSSSSTSTADQPQQQQQQPTKTYNEEAEELSSDDDFLSDEDEQDDDKNTSAARDWNKEFQLLVHLPDSEKKFAKLARLANEVCCRIAKIILLDHTFVVYFATFRMI